MPLPPHYVQRRLGRGRSQRRNLPLRVTQSLAHVALAEIPSVARGAKKAGASPPPESL